MRAELIGHFEPCMTDIYLHIDARMADYIRTHPYSPPPSSEWSPSQAVNHQDITVATAVQSGFHNKCLKREQALDGFQMLVSDVVAAGNARISMVGKSQSCMVLKSFRHQVGAPTSWS